jgi:hypothetical protein
VDVRSEIHPALKPRPGLESWKVYFRPEEDLEAKWYDDYTTLPGRRKRGMKETLFDQTYTSYNNDPHSSEKIDPLDIKKCMRFYPHDQNYGGFFVAVFEKTFDQENDCIYGEE